MPTIVATCPYCRAGGVRAPDSAVGANATCPKCRSNFTVVPDDGLPGWNPPARPQSTSEETTPHALAADVTEPSPVLTAEPVPQAAVPKRTSATPMPIADPAPVGFGVALSSAILYGLAMLATQFPYGRFIGPGVAALGLLVGLFALSAEGRTRVIAAGAMVLNAVAIAAVFLLPSWLGLESWRRSIPPGGPTAPQAVGHRTGLTAPADWVDAGQASWGFGDIRVSVRSATYGPIELTGPNGATRRTKEAYLSLVVRVANEGVERRIELGGWAAGGDGMRLTDPAGKALAVKRFESGWAVTTGPPRAAGVNPGKSAEVLVIYEAPTIHPSFLRLELPGAAVGVDGPIRFHLPESFFSVHRVP
jgi:hypothetical protein